MKDQHDPPVQQVRHGGSGHHHQVGHTAPTSTEDLVRDRPPVSGNPRNIGAVAGEPGSHPITMADDHDNDHDSDLEDRTPHKNADTTPNDTTQLNNKKDSPNIVAMEALQDRLKQLKEEAQHQREAEKIPTKGDKATPGIGGQTPKTRSRSQDQN